jgi:hypothetical protein
MWGTSFDIAVPSPEWFQGEVVVSNAVAFPGDGAASGLYECRFRYFDFEDSTWKLQDQPWILDATLHGGMLGVGERCMAYFHQQRGAFIPMLQPMPFISYWGRTYSPLPEDDDDEEEAEFWLEWFDGANGWVIGGRRFYINCYCVPGEKFAITGAGFISFRSWDQMRIRLAIISSPAIGNLYVHSAGLEIRAISPGGMQTDDEQLPVSMQLGAARIGTLVRRARRFTGDGSVMYPRFTTEQTSSGTGDDTVRIHLPDWTSYWTMEASFSITVSNESGVL